MRPTPEQVREALDVLAPPGVVYTADRAGKVAAARATLESALAPPPVQQHRPCGCVTCICEDEEKCHGCGARACCDFPNCKTPPPVEAEGAAVEEALDDVAGMVFAFSDKGRVSRVREVHAALRAALASLRSQVAAKEAEIERLRESGAAYCAPHPVLPSDGCRVCDAIVEARERANNVAAAENRGVRRAIEWLEDYAVTQDAGGSLVVYHAQDFLRDLADRREGKA